MIAKFPSKELKKNPLKIAKKELNDNGEEVEVEVEVAFPYVAGFDYSSTCQSIKVNGGLFTPCMTRPAKNSQFCTSCSKSGHKDGIMEERSKCAMLCYENKKGKREISFGTWLMKRGLERSDVESKFEEHYGVALPEEYWKTDKAKASRPVKTVSTSSDDEASVEGVKPAPKKRGRPKKAKKSDEVSNATSENGDNVKPVEETKSEPKPNDQVSESEKKPSPSSTTRSFAAKDEGKARPKLEEKSKPESAITPRSQPKIAADDDVVIACFVDIFVVIIFVDTIFV